MQAFIPRGVEGLPRGGGGGAGARFGPVRGPAPKPPVIKPRNPIVGKKPVPVKPLPGKRVPPIQIMKMPPLKAKPGPVGTGVNHNGGDAFTGSVGSSTGSPLSVGMDDATFIGLAIVAVVVYLIVRHEEKK